MTRRKAVHDRRLLLYSLADRPRRTTRGRACGLPLTRVAEGYRYLVASHTNPELLPLGLRALLNGLAEPAGTAPTAAGMIFFNIFLQITLAAAS
jgi:hypothetical protein